MHLVLLQGRAALGDGRPSPVRLELQRGAGWRQQPLHAQLPPDTRLCGSPPGRHNHAQPSVLDNFCKEMTEGGHTVST